MDGTGVEPQLTGAVARVGVVDVKIEALHQQVDLGRVPYLERHCEQMAGIAAMGGLPRDEKVSTRRRVATGWSPGFPR